MTYRHLNIRNLTYSEQLASLPWVMLRPNHLSTDEPCRKNPQGQGGCGDRARLMYLTLDGEIFYFCHHHIASMTDGEWYLDADHPEVNRVENYWRRHVRGAYTEKRLPPEEVNYQKHLGEDEQGPEG